MKLKNTISFLLLILTLNLFSQNISFKGKVFNEYNTPAKNITITIEGTNLSTKTDNDGLFEFNENIPIGKNIVTATGIGYKIKYFTVTVENNKNIFVQKIKMKFTKDEKRRRWVQDKVRKEEERRMQRERKKIVGKLKKNTDIASTTPATEETEQQQTKVVEKPIVYDEDVSQIQIKYSKELKVDVDDIFNEELYEYIDLWRGTPYLSKGNTKSGIDDINFVKTVLKNVFDLNVENAIDDVFNSKHTETFTDVNALEEGDLIFFKGSGDKSNQIVHIGIYLAGDKFIHAIQLKRKGFEGVQIDKLTNPFWKTRFASGGRRLYSE